MKKYLRLTCTTCKRDIDKLVDINRYTPDQCTITLGCEGRLQPVEYRSNANISVAPEIGVTDWRPRGSTTTDMKPLITPELISLETGSLKQLVLALPQDVPTFDLVMTVVADTPKSYRQYVYRKEGVFNTVSGVESGLEKKTLRFTAYGSNPDVVEVYVNGVKREQGTDLEDYQIYDGTSTNGAPPNTIVFNVPINAPGTTQVDVIVSKAATSSTVTLSFKRNVDDESRAGLGAYENISYVERMLAGVWTKYYLYTFDLDGAEGLLTLNSIMVPAEMDGFFMLARQPYTQVDRYADIVVLLEDMSVERDYIKYYAEDDVTTARVTATALANIYPPLRFSKFEVEKTIKKYTPGVEEQIVVDGRVITGPDA